MKHVRELTSTQYRAAVKAATSMRLQRADAESVVSDIICDILIGELIYEEGDYTKWFHTQVTRRAQSVGRTRRRHRVKFCMFDERIRIPEYLDIDSDDDKFVIQAMVMLSVLDGDLLLRSARASQLDLAREERCSPSTISRRIKQAAEAARKVYQTSCKNLKISCPIS